MGLPRLVRVFFFLSFFFFSPKATVKMELFLHTTQTGWATDGIYTLIPSSGRALGITKNTEETLPKSRRGRGELKEKEIRSLKIIFPEKTKHLRMRSPGIQYSLHFFACFRFFPEGLQTSKLQNLRRWRQATAPIYAGDGKMLRPPHFPKILQPIFCPLFNLFICHLTASTMEALKGDNLERISAPATWS